MIGPTSPNLVLMFCLTAIKKKIQVSSVSLVLGRTVKDDESVSRILSFAFSHNLQQLSVTCAPGNSIRFPYSFIVTPKWDLPALTTLHLHCVKLMSDDLFSKCTNLKNLILEERTLMEEMEVLSICHPRLSDLTLVSTPPDMELEEVVNVVAPQLKNLTIKWCEVKHLISAPGLTSLVIEGFHPCQSFTCTKPGFHSLEKVRIYFYDAGNADAHKIVSLLQQLHSVKLLTLNLQILQRLFSIEVYQELLHLAALLQDEITLHNYMFIQNSEKKKKQTYPFNSV